MALNISQNWRIDFFLGLVSHQVKETLDNVTLKEYSIGKKILDVSKAYDYTEKKFENINDAKMLFFTSYIAR